MWRTLPLTKSAAFKRLATREERSISSSSRQRRDPTPGTVENEFKKALSAHCVYQPKLRRRMIPGWKTDRGQIYITHGPPDERSRLPGAATGGLRTRRRHYYHIPV
jgi:GWxTD domain-containing protein